MNVYSVNAGLAQPQSQLLSPEETGDGVGDGVDWDAITKANAHKVDEVNTKQPERQLEDAAEITWAVGNLYSSAEAFFFNDTDLSAELDAIQETKEKMERKGGLFSCFRSQQRLSRDLDADRDMLFAIGKVKYDSSLAEHELILKHTYRILK